jgi:hypothetical protein
MRLPSVAVAPVAGEVNGRVEIVTLRQHVDAVVLVGGSDDAGRSKRRCVAGPPDPSPVLVQPHRFVGRAEGADLVGRFDDPFQCLHHLGTDGLPLPTRMHSDSFDVAGSKRVRAVEEPSLDHRGMPDDRCPAPGDGVHAAQRVLPVVVGHLAREHLVQQFTSLRQYRWCKLAGVGDL